MISKKLCKSISLLLLVFLNGCSVQGKNTSVAANNGSKDTSKTSSDSSKSKPSDDKDKKWKLVWSDEFNGNSINRDIWGFEMGYKRNHELQYYTDRPENARVEDGNLVIEARKEEYNGYAYTSASLNTKGKKSFKYGKIEMRAKLPLGKGIWPAFWTMGDEFKWPACGEIDIMELIGGGQGFDDKIYGTIHWDNNGHKKAGNAFILQSGTFADDYHVFGIEWDSSEVRWYLDGKQYFKRDIKSADMTEFHQKHWILLNLAVGGDWPGSPNDATVFPQKYYIDWVRVYQNE